MSPTAEWSEEQYARLVATGFHRNTLKNEEGGIDLEQFRVESVVEDKPLAKAGVQAGDVVLAVDAAKPDSVESFRRQLRRAVAKGEGVLKLRRGNENLSVTVKFPD